MKKTFILILTVLLLLGAACERYVDSRDPVRSLPEELPAPTNVVVALDSQAVTLSWDVSDTADVESFRIYSAESVNGTYTLRDTTTEYSVTLTNLSVNRTYYFTVASVGSGGIEGKRSDPIGATMGLLSIAIKNNDEFTNTRNVTIQLNSLNGTTNVMLSEDSLFTGKVWEPFSSQKSFQLSQGDGLKTVYAKFIFADGTRTGKPLSDQITLDTRALIDSVYFMPDDQVFVTGDAILFVVNAGETGGTATVSFKGVNAIALYDDGTDGDPFAGDGVYVAEYTVPNDLVVDNSQVTANFTDAAGNHATEATASNTLSIQAVPLAVQLTSAEALFSYKVSLSWTEAASTGFTSYRIYRDTTASVTTSSKLVTTINSQGTVTYPDTTVAENKTYYYRVYVYNTYGLNAGSNIESVKTPVNDPPEPVVLAAGLIDASTVGLSWSQNNEEDFASYRIYRSNSAIPDPPPENLLIKLVTGRATLSYDDFLASAGTYRYKVYVFDRQGKSTGSNEVQVSR